jgi:hypothetical protein
MIATKPVRLRNVFAIGAFFALLYFMLAWNKIDGQGIYYDELHQAPAAFSYIGLPQQLFSIGFKSLPILNTTYGGAIKSAIYGVYLRLTNKHFSIKSWRALGICIVMMGIIFFSLSARSSLSLPQLALFLAFLCSDPAVILATRHDWGPAALALALRLIFLGIAFNTRLNGKSSVCSTALLGIVVGLSIYEKLSSVAMLVPLALIVLFDAKRHSLKHYAALAGGLAVGAFPLVIVNVGSFVKHKSLVSLSNMSDTAAQTQHSFGGIIWEALAQSNGNIISNFILGIHSPVPDVAEVVLLSTILVAILAHGFYKWKKEGVMPLWGIMALSYVGLIAALVALPRSTWAHHWIIITPFQYAAIALWFPVAFKNLRYRAFNVTKLISAMWIIVVGLFLTSHILSTYNIERAFFEEKASPAWDRSITHLAEFANNHSSNSAFIAAGWGVGIQICCMGNGQRDLIYEPFWKYCGKSDIESIVKNSNKNFFYVISLVHMLDSTQTDTTSESIRLAADSVELWRSIPLDQQTEIFKAVKIKKYERIAGTM